MKSNARKPLMNSTLSSSSSSINGNNSSTPDSVLQKILAMIRQKVQSNSIPSNALHKSPSAEEAQLEEVDVSVLYFVSSNK